jgi:hypothetical protein
VLFEVFASGECAMRLAGLCLLVCCLGVRGQEIADRAPSSTRLLVGIHVRQLIESPLAKKYGEQLRAVFADWTSALVNLGTEPVQVEHIWLVAGDGYPRGTAIIIMGKIDPAKVDAKMQQHIRERRMPVRPFREENRPCFALETPVGLNPIPGLPATVFVSTRDDGIIVTFDQETLLLFLRPIEPGKSVHERFGPYKDALATQTSVVAACSPPESLTGTDALLTGVKTILANAVVEDGLKVNIEFLPGDAGAFQSRMNNGLQQARQLFGPLVTQQGVDPRMVQFFQELLASAKVASKDNALTMTAELTTETIGRIFKK